MRRATRAEKTTVRLQVKVELGGMRDLAVNDGSSAAVSAAVGVALALGEEADVVAFPDDENGDLGVDVEVLAGLCEQSR
jgi:hypothetical protein